MRAPPRTILISLILLLLPVLGAIQEAHPVSHKPIIWLELSDHISPATAEAVESAIKLAEEEDAQAVLITLDTFGGLLDSTFKIMETITRTKIPVIGFVHPPGGQALSAGTFILMATDFAAMAPATTIGSAQPVAGTTPITDPKTVNALIEKMVAAAELHGRNVTQATRFITDNDNLTPTKATALRVIEAVAATPEELIAMADGVTVTKVHGPVKLDLSDASLQRFDPGLRVLLLGFLSNPFVSGFLTSVGFIILILGLLSPGVGAEVAGAVMIILGLLGQGFNPNLIAFALMGFGAALIVFELYSGAHGVLAIVGVIALGFGISLTIIQPPSPLLVPREFVEAFLLYTFLSVGLAGGFFGFLIFKVLKARRMKRFLGYFPSGEGRAVDDLGPGKVGYVVIGGEYWKARSTVAVAAGTQVVSVGSQGGVLTVKPVEAQEASEVKKRGVKTEIQVR